MKLTNEITDILLSAKRIMDFWKALEKYDLEEEDWKANKMVLNHYEKLYEEMKRTAPPIDKIADDIPGFCSPNRKKKQIID